MASAVKIFKRIGMNLVTDAGVEVVRGYVLKRLSIVTSDEFCKAIKEGTHTLGATTEKDHEFAKRWTPIMEKLKINGQQIQRNKLTAANVLKWLETDRPDLAKVITDCKQQGRDWLEEDVKEMFGFLFSPQQNPSTPQQIKHLVMVKSSELQSTVKNDQSTS